MSFNYKSAYYAILHILADEAGKIARPLFRSALATETKDDRSPVTQADRAIEQKLREIIGKTFPDHGFIGEEFGAHNPGADFVWVVDPIDGTRAFMTGKPLFGTIIGLMHAGKPVMGLVDQPFTHERWLGQDNAFAEFNGKPIRVAAPRTLGEARLFTGSPNMFFGDNFDRYLTLCKTARWPQYGCDCYAYGLMAMGCADLVVEQDLKLHDVVGIAPIVTGAGGVAVDWNLREIDASFGKPGGFIAASSMALAEETAALLRG